MYQDFIKSIVSLKNVSAGAIYLTVTNGKKKNLLQNIRRNMKQEIERTIVNWVLMLSDTRLTSITDWEKKIHYNWKKKSCINATKLMHMHK